jgi:DNA-binding IclR family transcriptional regulator
VAQAQKTVTGIRQPARRKRRLVAEGASASPDFVEALARGLRVLRCFGPDARSLGNLELAQLTGLPKSTVSRIVYTLTSLGYLRYHTDTGQYSPDVGVLALGYGLLASLEIRQLARPFMQELAERTGAAVALGRFDGESMVYVEAIHGSSALYLRLPVGYRLGMDSTMGRACLAHMQPQRRKQLLALLAGTKPDAAQMTKALSDYQATGCCFGMGDWQQGINAIAVPFTPLTQEGSFVISCGGPATLLPEDRLRGDVAAQMREIVSRLAPGEPGNRPEGQPPG